MLVLFDTSGTAHVVFLSDGESANRPPTTVERRTSPVESELDLTVGFVKPEDVSARVIVESEEVKFAAFDAATQVIVID